MDKAKLFVSFSSADRAFVRRLFFRLDAQHVEYWNYAREGEEIPGGAIMDDFLSAKIDGADVFLPILSAASFSSDYTKMEVKHALNRAGKGLRIIPWCLSTAPNRTDWNAPFSELKGFRFYEVAAEDSANGTSSGCLSLEEAIQKLCSDLRVPYVPLPIEDPRLPFMERFEAELKAAQEEGMRTSRHPERDLAVFVRLSHARVETNEALRQGLYADALVRINYFIALCKYELPQVELYFPRLVEAICLITGGQLSAATLLLEELRTRSWRNPKLPDENVFGALGFIKHQQGDYTAAMQCYQAAVTRDPDDPAAKAGWLLSALEQQGPAARNATAIDEMLKAIDAGKIHLPEDRMKVQALKAVAFTSLGRFELAFRIYEELLNAQDFPLSVLLHYVAALRAAQPPQEERALRLLLQYHARFQNEAGYLHSLASLQFRQQQWNEACATFDRLVDLFPRDRQYRIDAAQAHLKNGNSRRAQQLAASLSNPELFSLPVGPSDFFCDGFAQWILGKRERADYDFERSGAALDIHYSRILRP